MQAFYPQGVPQLPHQHTYGATTLVFHLAVFFLLFEFFICFVFIIVNLVASVFGCFGKVDCFPTCASAVADYIVRVDFLHVVFIFFFGCSRTNISSTPDVWKGRVEGQVLLGLRSSFDCKGNASTTFLGRAGHW